MHIKSAWSYINKGLLAILSFLVVSTIASIIYLAYTLLSLHSLTIESSRAVSTAFVLQGLLLDLQEMQTGVRGYVVTGDNTFLEPYSRARSRVPSDLRIIRSNKDLLLAPTEVQRLVTLTTNHLALMERIVQVRDAEGFEAAQLIVQSKEGEIGMENIRKEITSISSYGLQNIGPMQRRSEANTKRALIVAGTMALFVLGTCAAVIWYFKRTILQERALESTKNEFLSLASHQLRTPATNVKQYIGLLLDGYMGDLNDQQRHALTIAYKNNESEISIMNNLLDVAKLDLDRIQLHKKVVNVAAVTRQVIRDYLPLAKERHQTIRLDSLKQVMASVDEAYLRGVIENLLDNAIKYSKEGTPISVKVGREEDDVCISVKDKGLGIRKRDYTKLFNKFSRLDNEFSANSQGSGLGLYWVKQIVKLHHGSVDVNSREGKGSEFVVRLPVR